MDRQTEMMICMKEQGYSLLFDGRTISFPINSILNMWDILRDEDNYEEVGRNPRGCHNCIHSFRGKDTVLHCRLNGMTMVTNEQSCFEPKTNKKIQGAEEVKTSLRRAIKKVNTLNKQEMNHGS